MNQSIRARKTLFLHTQLLLPTQLFRLSLLFLSTGTIPIIAQFGDPGCQYPRCINPIPCANCSGKWTDDVSALWDVDTNAVGSVSGNVKSTLAFGCPTWTWQVSGSISKYFGGPGYNGFTTFTWTASNPSPYTP